MKLIKRIFIILTTILITIPMNSAMANTRHERLSINQKIRDKYTSYPAVLLHYLETDSSKDYLMNHGYTVAVIKKAKEITKDFSTNYDKSKAIHDWVANNIWYNYDYFDGASIVISDFNADGVLKNKATVCYGYAILTLVLHRAVGIPAKLVIGEALSPNRLMHAWNEVYVDNRWVIIDTTWDSNNTYENGSFSSKAQCASECFDPTIEHFSRDHEYIASDSILYTNEFFDEEKDTSITIPEGFTALGHSVFTGNKYLKMIKLPNTLEELQTNAFEECYNLKSIKLSNKLVKIPDGSFRSCYRLKQITIPVTVTSIGEEAFAGCDSLTKIIIPSSVKVISESAFGGIGKDYIKNGKKYHKVHYAKDLIIYGENNSEVHKYAVKHKISFVAIK